MHDIVKLLYNELLLIIAATCPDLPQLSNGVITYTPATRLEGVDATYSCVDGFQLSDTITRVCEDSMNRNGVGVWNGMEPTCIGMSFSLGHFWVQ